jgi:glycosyltransferase involved in cell wall biosynthesis
MRVAFSTGRPAHSVLPANLLAARGIDVTIYTAATRSRFRGLEPRIGLCWTPQFVSSFHFLTGVQLPRPLQRADTVLYDQLVALRMGQFDLFWGWATGALSAGRAAKKCGAKFVLDRACPHVDIQQALVREESARLGVAYHPEPAWFRWRQLAEYDEADLILVPSQYSRRSFPAELQSKVLIAPLFGRVPQQNSGVAPSSKMLDRPFTFGAVGAQPLRKGFLYLLQAWEQLKLPNARLLLRTDAPLGQFPALRDLLARLPNVEIVGYQRDMSDFYRRCNAFVFPTVDDGFGMALLEAMTHGLPAIATDHCGAAELFTTDKELLIVPAQDASTLGAAMERVYSSAELRESLSSHARQRLRQIGNEGDYSLYAQTLDRVLASVLPQP